MSFYLQPLFVALWSLHQHSRGTLQIRLWWCVSSNTKYVFITPFNATMPIVGVQLFVECTTISVCTLLQAHGKFHKWCLVQAPIQCSRMCRVLLHQNEKMHLMFFHSARVWGMIHSFFYELSRYICKLEIYSTKKPTGDGAYIYLYSEHAWCLMAHRVLCELSYSQGCCKGWLLLCWH